MESAREEENVDGGEERGEGQDMDEEDDEMGGDGIDVFVSVRRLTHSDKSNIP